MLKLQKQNKLDEAPAKITLDNFSKLGIHPVDEYEGTIFDFSHDMSRVDFELER